MIVKLETIDHLPNCTGNVGRYTELVIRVTGGYSEIEAYRKAISEDAFFESVKTCFLSNGRS